MKFSVFQVSRRGGREKNEDRMGYCYTRESGLFAVADGMGGHPHGEVAAQLALQTISAMFQRHARPRLTDVGEFLSDALLAAHHQILRHALDRGMVDTPRTTLVAAVVQEGRAQWIHCGDSRLYMVRDGALLARTRDHSYMELRNMAIAGLEKVNRNVLFTCLGSPGKPVIDIAGPVSLQPGDRVLLCSDGLTDMLSDASLASLFEENLPLARLQEALIEAANAAGGKDNIGVVLIEQDA